MKFLVQFDEDVLAHGELWWFLVDDYYSCLVWFFALLFYWDMGNCEFLYKVCFLREEVVIIVYCDQRRRMVLLFPPLHFLDLLFSCS
jgi:hypothetical protein